MHKTTVLVIVLAAFAVLGYIGAKGLDKDQPDYVYGCVSVYEHDFDYPRKHLRTAVDTAYERYGVDCMELAVHYTTEWFVHAGSKAKGRLYKSDKKAYIGIQKVPEQTASLVVHELGHWYLFKWKGIEDADPYHSDKEFWSLADHPVILH
jgi:hypothetical protein